jgi:signal transduction histidine kinase
MIVPTIATIVVGALGLKDKIASANDADRTRTLSALSSEAGGLIQQLQNERASAVLLLSSPDGPTKVAANDAFTKQAPASDEAANSYRLRRSALADAPTQLRTVLSQLDDALQSDLPKLRDQVRAGNQGAIVTVAPQYRGIIAELLSIRESAAQLTPQPQLTADLQSAAAISSLKEYVSQERVVILRALAQPEFGPTWRNEFNGAVAGQDQSLVRFKAAALPDEQTLLNQTLVGSDVNLVSRYEGEVRDLPATGKFNPSFTAADWDRAFAGKSSLLRDVEANLDRQIIADATAERDALQRFVLIQTGLLLGMLLLAILFAWLVARSMARSLRELRHGALTVAQYGLPQAVARLRDPALATHMSSNQLALQLAEPLPVRSRDEFGQVTEAFNAVHLEAVRTAAEQAQLRASVSTMFVNLARRSQILVDRLIGHLDRLERGEEDPDRLGELFQLDHLATRMRRNDENLLVLAGADSTRIQRDHAPLMDVLRAAQSEVEHYVRVEFGTIDRDVEIAAHAVNDMVHLIAELLDNATVFSPPDSAVVVEARRVGDRAMILVEDRGIGISFEQLAELNDRLANPPMVDVAVSRMMGLVVVARLAARHGVKVELRPARERGTIADVMLPTNVLVVRAIAGRGPSAGTPVAGREIDRPVPPPRSPLGAPLALESGPSTGRPFDPAEAGRAAAGAGRSPTSGAGVGGSVSFGKPGSGLAGAAEFGAAGFGAAPGFGGTPAFETAGFSDTDFRTRSGAPASGAAGPPPARGLPAWSDLTGVNGSEARSTTGGPNRSIDPLPQRHAGDHWTMDGEAVEADTGTAIPRQRPVIPEGPQPGVGTSQPAELPTQPPQPPQPAQLGGGAPVRPNWPPSASQQKAEQAGTEREPDARGSEPATDYAPALDMTDEIPRVRLDWEPAESAAPGAALSNGNGDSGEPHRPGTDKAVPDKTVPDKTGPDKTGPDKTGPDKTVPDKALPDETMELPIFRELESAWFRTRKSVAGVDSPVLAGNGNGLTPALLKPAGEAAPLESTASPSGAPPADQAEPVAVEAAAGPEPEQIAAVDSVTWRSAADDGWRAAEALEEDKSFATTETGLPKRVPMSQLVPGGVEKASTSALRRTPEGVRGLLSAYHRGVQRGRTQSPKVADPNTPEPSPAGPQPPHGGKEQEA